MNMHGFPHATLFHNFPPYPCSILIFMIKIDRSLAVAGFLARTTPLAPSLVLPTNAGFYYGHVMPPYRQVDLRKTTVVNVT